ncbi:MAG TPA: hypothetical protein VNJ50_11780 [Gelidibacter sp.]|uniref:hypothetical protein n=1 Tax=Gelidibacter sp. TaxID=2018083 RepID=UPI002C8D8502|nr:hypothetical protein [Gelidibacter sp.]HXJ99522.1 hypothetical protein [Gelidibacter sp.]
MEWDYGGGDGYNGGNPKEVWDCGGGKVYNPRTKACECPAGMVDNGYECVLKEIEKDIAPSCKSFNFINTSSNWQESAVKNIRFKIVVLSAQGVYVNFDVSYTSPILFGVLRNMIIGGNINNGLAAELSAKALAISMKEVVALYGNTVATELQVRMYFEQRLKYNYPIITNGGRVQFNAMSYTVIPTEYKNNFFGMGNCD